jgi:predicted metal-dependent phosphoesterase TrpH
MTKVDLHMHSGEDPEDGLRYPATALIDRAVELGFGAIAITLHNKVLDDERVFDYARTKGLLLIRSVEWNVERSDVLLYNVTQREVERIATLADLRAFKRERGDDLLIVAPHPYFPVGQSLKRQLEPNIDLFDAIEYAQIHLQLMNRYNQQAVRVAHKHNKPIIANSDSHNLWMFGRHYTLVDAEPTIPSIFRAIREGRVEWHSPHISIWACLRMFVFDPMLERSPGKIMESFGNHAAK